MPIFRSWPAALFSAWVVVTPILSGCVTVAQSSNASQQSNAVATGQTQTPGVESPAPAPATSAPALRAVDYAIYQGHYTCAQGKTALTLKINMTGSAADAVFDFKTRRAIQGAFAMQGTFDGKTRKIRLQGKNWINQPKNFSTVDLLGTFNADRSRLSGQVIGGGCSTFEVRKTGTETVVAAPAKQQSGCTVKDADIATTYVGECRNGLAHGPGEATGRNGDKYVGEFHDGEKHGKGIYTWQSGSRYEGEYKNDKFHGKGIHLWRDGSRYDGEYKEGKRSGPGVMRLTRGNNAIEGWGNQGKWVGDNFVVQGIFDAGRIVQHCADMRNCQLAERLDSQNKSLAMGETGAIRAKGFLANSPHCYIEHLGEFFQKNEIPKWHGLCWDGKAQGPGVLRYPSKGSALKYDYDAKGLVINGMFRTGPKLTNAKMLGNWVDDGLRQLDLKKIGPEEFAFFEKFEKSESIQFSGGCKLMGGGLFRRDWNGEDYDDLAEKFGANWIDAKGMNHYARTIPRSVKLLTPCTGEFVQGRARFSWDKYMLIIDDVVDGVPVGKITLEGYKNDSIFFWYYKGIWFDKYKDYMETVTVFDRYFKKTAGKPTSGKINALKKGFSIEANSEELKYEVEQALGEAFDVKFSFSASEKNPAQWNESILGFAAEGIQGSTNLYLHWKISPKKSFTLPKDVSSIHMKLDAGAILKKKNSMGWIATRDEESIANVVSMSLARNSGFASSGKIKVFDVQTYISSGGKSGVSVVVENIKPRISIRSIEVK